HGRGPRRYSVEVDEASRLERRVGRRQVVDDVADVVSLLVLAVGDEHRRQKLEAREQPLTDLGDLGPEPPAPVWGGIGVLLRGEACHLLSERLDVGRGRGRDAKLLELDDATALDNANRVVERQRWRRLTVQLRVGALVVVAERQRLPALEPVADHLRE